MDFEKYIILNTSFIIRNNFIVKYILENVFIHLYKKCKYLQFKVVEQNNGNIRKILCYMYYKIFCNYNKILDFLNLLWNIALDFHIINKIIIHDNNISRSRCE